MPRNPYQQTRLFAPLGMMRQPHQMSPTQFANSPRTMIHGSDEEDFEDLRALGPRDVTQAEQGFHVGTPAAADERLNTRHMSAVEGFYHPVRVDRSRMSNTPDNPIPDEGDDWFEESHHSFYRNQYEDKGSISAVVGEAGDVTHYADFVHDALDMGKIPSGAAEHFATQFDTEHSEHSPGIPRGLMKVERDEYETGSAPEGRSRIEHREDLYASPVTRAHREMGIGQEHQPSMFVNRETYDDEGWPVGSVLAPNPQAVSPENRAAVDAEDEERKAPWLNRLFRESAEQGATVPAAVAHSSPKKPVVKATSKLSKKVTD